MYLFVCVIFNLFVFINADPSSGKEILIEGLSLNNVDAMGIWTDWLNGDSPRGTGDFENVGVWFNNYNNRPNSVCALPCSNPLALEWRLADDNLNEDLVDKCLVLEMERISTNTGIYPGFNCLNSKQRYSDCTRAECETIGMTTRKRDINCDKCPDFEVRYLCAYSDANKIVAKAISEGETCDSDRKREQVIESDDGTVAQNLDLALDSLLSSRNSRMLEQASDALQAASVDAEKGAEQTIKASESKVEILRDLLRAVLEDK